MNRKLKEIVAVICSLALVICSITVYNSTTAKAAEDYSQLNYEEIKDNDNNEFSQTLKDSKIAVYSGSVALDVKQYQNSGFNELYLALGKVSAEEFKATINGYLVEAVGTGIHMKDAYKYLTYEYNVLNVSWKNGNAVLVIWCPSNSGKGTWSEGETTTPDPNATTQLAKPSKVKGLEAHINNLKTDYTIAFASVDKATSYKLYIDGVFKREIRNGGGTCN